MNLLNLCLTSMAGWIGEDPAVTLGPYLQLATPTSVHICWHTDQDSEAVVRFGDDPDQLDREARSASTGTTHQVLVKGLDPETRYYYSVGSPEQQLVGGDEDHQFRTPPVPGTSRPTRIWVLGDSGTADASAAAVRDAYYQRFGYEDTDLWLMLGDNAYTLGALVEYQRAVFDMYPEILRRVALWPTRGNHEYFEEVYYDLFTLPMAGEAGGMPSGSEAYYSFDHGNIHFICLDSQGTDRSIDGAMAAWVESDLAATEQEWIIAFWHHPPYTRGSHNSDVGPRMRKMRQTFVPLLEAGGVDLVLSGHSHSYERSYLIHGHHENSSTFEESMKVDPGNGREEEDGAYRKIPLPDAGAVYCVAGSSGRVSAGPWNHPAMVHAAGVLGSLVIKVDGNRLDLLFLNDSGNIDDHMTLIHDRWRVLTRGPRDLESGARLTGSGSLIEKDPVSLHLEQAPTNSRAMLVVGFEAIDTAFHGGTMVPFPDFVFPGQTDSDGSLYLESHWPGHLPPMTEVYFQYWLAPANGSKLQGSNAVLAVTP